LIFIKYKIEECLLSFKRKEKTEEDLHVEEAEETLAEVQVSGIEEEAHLLDLLQEEEEREEDLGVDEEILMEIQVEEKVMDGENSISPRNARAYFLPSRENYRNLPRRNPTTNSRIPMSAATIFFSFQGCEREERSG